jgi:peptide chain release factor 1
MLEKLQSLEDRYEELSQLMSDPDLIADQAEWQKLARAHAGLTEIVGTFRRYKEVEKGVAEAESMLADAPEPDFRELVEQELDDLKAEKERLHQQLTILLLPRDPNDDKNVIMEIRAGAGGEEAALFAANLFRMYGRYAERNGWRAEMMNANYTDIGGFKEVIFLIEGVGAYSRLKFESGVHRVQRIPSTESGGRIHTSTATVAEIGRAHV